MPVMTKYPQQLLDYFYQLDHAGLLAAADNVFMTEEGTEQQGEVVRLYLLIENDIIKKARFKSFGSVALIACCEFICRWLENKHCDEAKQLNTAQILTALDLSDFYNHTAVLVLQCVKKLLARQG